MWRKPGRLGKLVFWWEGESRGEVGGGLETNWNRVTVLKVKVHSVCPLRNCKPLNMSGAGGKGWEWGGYVAVRTDRGKTTHE